MKPIYSNGVNVGIAEVAKLDFEFTEITATNDPTVLNHRTDMVAKMIMPIEALRALQATIGDALKQYDQHISKSRQANQTNKALS